MADKTKIEWTDATWNPITGCSLVSEGCRNCYAAELAETRLRHHPSRVGLAVRNAAGVAKFTGEVRFNEQWLAQPLTWKKPRRIFVCAHGDLFHENVPDEWINRVFAVMALCPQHTFQVLTKRPERMQDYLTRTRRQMFAGPLMEIIEAARVVHLKALYNMTAWPLPNIWLGTSVEDQPTANERIPFLLATPAAKRFISAEPLLGPVDLSALDQSSDWRDTDALRPRSLMTDIEEFGEDSQQDGDQPALDWVIVGGESGKGARPMHPDWVRNLRDQCAAAGVPFFFKQWGEFREWDENGPAIVSVDVGTPEADAITARAINPHWIAADGTVHTQLDQMPDCVPCRLIERVGKKAAGALLDGVEHREFPSA